MTRLIYLSKPNNNPKSYEEFIDLLATEVWVSHSLESMLLDF